MNTTLLRNARTVRRQLLASARYSAASIRDAVELAADNLRHIEEEDDAERRETAWVAQHAA